MASTKIWKIKKQTPHFSIQLCFCVQKDSSTLTVLKVKIILVELLIRNVAYPIYNVLHHFLAREKGHFKGFKIGGIFSDKKAKLYSLKSLNRKWYLFFDFVCFSGCHFTKSGLFQKQIGNRGGFFGFMHVSQGNNW